MRMVGSGVNVKGVKCRGEHNDESDESERERRGGDRNYDP